MLEETWLPYEAHLVDIMENESHLPEFLALNPNGKIPAIIDPGGPGGQPLGLFESGAILMYLADKTGKFIPADAAARWETIQWVFFQMASIGPMFGQDGFFNKFAGKDYEDKRPLQRYVNESKRLLGVLDGRLEGRTWIMGDEYTIADIATLGWVDNLIGFYEARELVEFDRFGNVAAWLERGLGRPAGRGLQQLRRQGLRGQSAAAAVRQRGEAAAVRARRAARGPDLGDGRRVHLCSHRHAGLGGQPDLLLRGAGTGGVRPLRERGGLARARAGAAGGAAGVGDSLARVATGAVALLILWSGFSRELCCCPSPCEGRGRLGGGVHGSG